MFKMAFQVVFSAKNVPRFSFGLLVAPKPKKQGGAIMAPPWVTTSFQSLGKIGLSLNFCLIFLACVSPDFLCNDGTCLDSVKVCDGIKDCSNGEDELYEKCNGKY